MTTASNRNSLVLDALAFYFSVLFLYTAFSKLTDFTTFQFDLHRDPIVGWLGTPISIGLPAVEIMIAALLLFRRGNRIAWWLSFYIMLVFTGYVMIILTFIPHKDIPCSCGGLIRFMSWRNHLLFNAATTLLAVGGIRVARKVRGQLSSNRMRGDQILYNKLLS